MNIHEKFFSKIGLNYAILGISAIIIQIVLLNIIGILHADLLSDFNMLVILTSLCNYILPFPIFYFLMRKIASQKLEKHPLDIKIFLLYFAISITLMWIGNIAGLLITAAIGNFFQTDIINPVERLINSSDIMLNLMLVSIIGPIFEEILFRKFLVDRTIKYGARVSIILSAIIFGFFHGNISQFFYAFLLGGFFAYVYIRTGKIIYTILLHISLNLLGSVISLFMGESAQAVLSNAFGPFDLAVVGIYFLVIISAFLFGTYGLLMYKKGKFNGAKTQIALKNPIKTMILNPGMICFVAFFIIEIIYVLTA
ncbi:CPBP family glutamic-type intramembrane protease [Methanobrevibacter sp.]|uniref:CPBP family glutamic-type intramembrane protease n=1 Tax=Methanobrevibacter sp. TaxID=66852 RepID=UPI0026E04D85|nr:CPBP family glutamic-type intramembrane protease [Methanobrevibacter sp.]MDO5860667.1 CPBP family glutamic-type intramembrane protease [Methanobrevibacter sp.]